MSFSVAEKIQLAQLAVSTCGAIASGAIAFAALRISRTNAHGLPPVAVLSHRKIEFGGTVGGFVYVTMDFTIWNRLKYPIHTISVELCFDRIKFETFAPGVMIEYNVSEDGAKAYKNINCVIEPSQNHKITFELPVKDVLYQVPERLTRLEIPESALV